MTIMKFRHSSIHKVSINMVAEGFDFDKFEEEKDLFRESWFTVQVLNDWEPGVSEFRIEFSHFHPEVVHSAAEEFVRNSRRHSWWKEV